MRKVKAGGILLFSSIGKERFLLMVHPHRYDLPKGHTEPGESALDCAVREFTEETGIPANAIDIEPAFRFDYTYFPKYKKFNYETVEKKLSVFIAYLRQPQKVTPTEHENFLWLDWSPPHRIQEFTIDPLLREAERFFENEAKL